MNGIPNIENAILYLEKVTDYLLSDAHPDGRSKSVFLKRFGFLQTEPQVLVDALKAHPTINIIVETKFTDYGIRYVVECSIRSPDGRNPCIRTVWQENNSGLPVFITAYPNS